MFKVMVLALLLCATVKVSAAEYYTTVSLGYVYYDTRILTNFDNGDKVELFDTPPVSYHIEMGKSFSDDKYRVGMHWTDYLGSDPDALMNPYRLEIFADRIFHSNYADFKIGAGWSLTHQDTTSIDANGLQYPLNLHGNKGRVTARFAISKTFGKVTVAIEHHSNWFAGAPFSNNWELAKDELTISYTF